MESAIAKSYLYAPADQLDRLLRSGQRGADAVIADLEDSVAPEARNDALRNVVQFLALAAFPSQRWVRLNPSDGPTQLKAILTPGLTGVVLPEVGLPTLEALDTALNTAEQDAGVTVGATPVTGLVETAAAIRDIHEIAQHPRLTRLGMGEADLRADLGIESSPDERELLPLRSAVVLASAAAGIVPPTASTSTNFRDLEALSNSTRSLYRLGFRARTAIHPAQIPVINDVFTPSATDIAGATDLIERYEAAQGRGEGVTLDAHGNMVDLAVVRRAYDILRRA